MQEVPVISLGFPCKGEGSSLSLEIVQGNSRKYSQEAHKIGLQAASYGPKSVNYDNVNLPGMWTSAHGRGTVFSCGEDHPS